MIKEKAFLENKVQYWPFIKKESGRSCSTVGRNKPDHQVPMGGVWRPSISHCVLLGFSSKRFPCLWKINLFEYSKTRYPLKVSTGTSHRVRPVRHLHHEQQPETCTFFSFTASAFNCNSFKTWKESTLHQPTRRNGFKLFLWWRFC